MDGDHLVAVATIVTRERRFVEGALIGVLWGIGHTVTLGLAVGAMLALGVPSRIPAAGLEIVVAGMLVALGVARLREAVKGFTGLRAGHVRAEHAGDHDHGGVETIHHHPHVHRGHVHDHVHVHPSRRLAAALAGAGGWARLRPLLVGAVHGMAGSAGVSLVVLASVSSAWGAALSLALFGLGTIVGMTALTAAMAFPLSLTARVERTRHALGAVAGVASIVFGLVYGLHALGGWEARPPGFSGPGTS